MSLKRYQIWLLAGAIALCVFAGERLFNANYVDPELVELPSMKYIHVSDNGMAIDRDDWLWIWGDNFYGQINPAEENTIDSHREPRRFMPSVAMAKSTRGYCAVLKMDGSLWTWGKNTIYGKLGNGTTDSTTKPRKILDDVIDFDVMGYGGMAIRSDGSLWRWGRLFEMEEFECYLEPVKIAENVSSVSLAPGHYFYVQDNELYAVGGNEEGQLGDGTTKFRCEPVVVMSDIAIVEAGMNHQAAIDTQGNLWMWGAGGFGCLGLGEKYANMDIKEPQYVLDNVADVSVESYNTMILRDDGSLWVCGLSTPYDPPSKNYEHCYLIPMQIEQDVISISNTYGATASFYVKKDGSLWAWGEQYWLFGKAGNEEPTRPQQITHGYIIN